MSKSSYPCYENLIALSADGTNFADLMVATTTCPRSKLASLAMHDALREQALKQIEDVLGRYGASPDDPRAPTATSSHGPYLTTSFHALGTAVLVLVERLAPGSAYVDQVRAKVEQRGGYDTSKARDVLAIAAALHADIKAGYLASVEDLIQSSVFDDFLSMAEELLDKGYAPPAAVLAGSVLEDHLKQLGARQLESPPRKVEQLTHALVKARTLSALEQKQVTTLYAIRTAAAHGRHDEVHVDDVHRMIGGVRDFIVRHST